MAAKGKGKRASKKREPILFHQATIGEREIGEVIQTLRSGWLTTGPKTHRFEEAFKRYIGCRHAIGINSCTAGLHLALAALGIGPGDEVITSPITFPATANVIVHQGAKPVFVDVSPNTLNINARLIEEKITKKTKAIIPVHFAGYPCDMNRIMRIAKKHNLKIVEDGAHAIETWHGKKKVGTIGDFAAFSFYATKNITTGEGGMIVTDNDELAEKVRMMRLHGLSRDAWKRYGKEGYHHWELHYPGFKYNMFDIQAALGLHQLARIESFLKKRAKIVALYDELLRGIPEIALLKREGAVKHAHHLYVVVVKSERLSKNRDQIMSEMQRAGIGVGVHFRTLHLQPYYKKQFSFKEGSLPRAEYASERVLSLPLYPGLSLEKVRHIGGTFKKIIEKAR